MIVSAYLTLVMLFIFLLHVCFPPVQEAIDVLAPIAPCSDTLTVSGPAAVLFHPDSVRLMEWKAEKEADDFFILADDAQWYTAKSRTFLKEKGLLTIDTDQRCISFVQENGNKIHLRTDTLEPVWGLILFDGLKEPLVTYPVEAEIEYQQYFGFD